MKVAGLVNISKYRTEIMGWAILGVMLAHVKTICGFPDTILNKVLGVFCYSVFTGGFLLLSGFGLYNSMHYDNNVRHFYRKRVFRLLVPYWIISTPYFVYTDLLVGEGISSFIGHVTTLSFWVSGNFSGMWYISVSVLLYAIFPFFYRFVYNDDDKDGDNSIRNLLYVLIMLAILKILLQECAFDYYEKISVAINGSALFAVGSLLMSWIVVKKESFSKREVVELVLMVGAILILNNYWGIVHILSIFTLSFIFPTMQKSTYYLPQFSVIFLKWLGTYTLELYIIHLLCFYILNAIFGVENQGDHIVIGCVVALLMCVPINRLLKNVVTKT